MTHGFTIAFYALAGIAFAGAVVAAALTESKPPVVAEEPQREAELALEAA